MGLVLVLMPQAAWAKLYGNARFGFFVEIPAAFTLADPEPENGDGRRFHTADHSAELDVAGGWITEDNFEAEIELFKSFEVKDGWKLTYESKVSAASAIYSGQKGDRIFYARTITSCGGKAHADYRLEYPIADKAKYDAAIKSINATLKASKGSCG
ncbi:MAG: hypothetical protein ABI230_08345 [Aestuariivirga sp.]